MSVSSATVSVTTAATALATCPVGDFNGQDFLIVNNGAATVYLGGSDVTTSIGTPLVATAGVTVSLEPSEVLYGIAASGTLDVRVLTVTGSR